MRLQSPTTTVKGPYCPSLHCNSHLLLYTDIPPIYNTAPLCWLARIMTSSCPNVRLRATMLIHRQYFRVCRLQSRFPDEMREPGAPSEQGTQKSCPWVVSNLPLFHLCYEHPGGARSWKLHVEGKQHITRARHQGASPEVEPQDPAPTATEKFCETCKCLVHDNDWVTHMEGTRHFMNVRGSNRRRPGEESETCKNGPCSPSLTQPFIRLRVRRPAFRRHGGVKYVVSIGCLFI